jgi:MFS transporter, DHA1 family, multidrug resistance protein
MIEMKKRYKPSLANPLISLCTIVFVLTIGTGIVAPLLAAYSLDLGANGLWIGFIYSGFYMIRFIFGNPIGRLADRIGPKGILTVSITIYPIIALAYFFAGHLYTLLGARLLHGLASAMLLPMAMTYIGEITPKGKEGTYMGIYNTVLFLANGVGPILGGFIADWWGVKEAFLLLLVLAIVSMVLTYTTLASTRKSDLLINNKRLQTGSEMKTPLWKNRGIVALASIYFISAILTIFIISFFPLFGIEKGFSTLQIGVLIAIFNMTVGICQVPFGKMADQFDKNKILLFTTIGIAFLFFKIPHLKTFLAICAFVFLLSLLTAMVIASSSALSSETGRFYGMGTTMGFLSSSTSLGMVIGPLLSGMIMDFSTTNILFYVIGVGWIISALLLLLSTSSVRNRWRLTKSERTFSNDHS